MNLNVRGSLGTQVMEYLCGLAQLIEHDKCPNSLSKITINTANTVDHSKVDYLSRIFNLDIPVVFVDDSKKFGAFDAYSLENLIVHRKEINEYIKFKNPRPHNEAQNIIHYRNGDRQCLSDVYYQKIFKIIEGENSEPITVIGNDKERMKTIFPESAKIISGDPNLPLTAVLDWTTIRQAAKVTGGFSAFTISAALLSTYSFSRFNIYVDKANPGISSKDLEALNFFDSLKIITKKESHIDDL
jgi:hypothetical protein